MKAQGQIVVEGITFTIFDVPGDGNCMFHALCKDPYFAEKGFEQQRLRNELADKVEQLYESHHRVKQSVEENVNECYDGTINKLLRRIRTSTNWCGEYECTFIAMTFPVRVLIYTPSLEPGKYEFRHSSDVGLDIFRCQDLQNRDEQLHIISLMFYYSGRDHNEGRDPILKSNHFTWLRNDENIDVLAANEKKRLRLRDFNEKHTIDLVENDDVEHIPVKETDLTKCFKSDESVIDEPTTQNANLSTKKVKLTVGEWYELAVFFHDHQDKYKSQKAFLESNDSDPLSTKHFSSFSRNYNAYKNGILSSKIHQDRERNRLSPFYEIESALLQYLKKKKFELSHKELCLKALEIWKNSNPESKVPFTASKGWLHRFLKREQIYLIRK
jgi:hypothetical protein